MPPPTSRSAYPNPSVPTDLLALYRKHASSLPSLSSLLSDEMRRQLLAIGVTPPAKGSPTRTAAATRARSAKRSGAASGKAVER